VSTPDPAPIDERIFWALALFAAAVACAEEANADDVAELTVVAINNFHNQDVGSKI
jgi:hypothetical protein